MDMLIIFRSQAQNNELRRVASFRWRSRYGSPVFRNVKAPLELEMDFLVVVHEARQGVVVASRKHSRGGFFLVD